MRVVIIGGGLAGVTLAAALTARGVEFDVVERSEEFAPAGAGIALMPPALRIVDRLGLGEAVRTASGSLPTLRWLTKSGKLLREVEYAALWQGREVRSIHRHLLHQVLLSTLRPERFVLGDTVREVIELEGQVEVRTESGRILRGDLAVGADGVHSLVRRDHFETERPRFLGTNYWRAALNRDDLVQSYTNTLARGRALGLAPLGRGRTHFLSQTLSIEPIDDPTQGRVDRLRQAFSDFTGVASDALHSLSSDQELHFGHGYEVTPLKTPWNGHRIVVIGDAAHASAPTLGLWGAMAMEDAWVLADELARSPISDALPNFCRRRSPRVQWVQERTHAWVERMRAPDGAVDIVTIHQHDYAPLLNEP